MRPYPLAHCLYVLLNRLTRTIIICASFPSCNLLTLFIPSSEPKSSIMKFSSIPAGLMLLVCHILAMPIEIDPEIEASKRIDELQKQYQHNIFKTISNRTTGCTSRNVQHRKEWYLFLFSCFFSGFYLSTATCFLLNKLPGLTYPH